MKKFFAMIVILLLVLPEFGVKASVLTPSAFTTNEDGMVTASAPAVIGNTSSVAGLTTKATPWLRFKLAVGDYAFYAFPHMLKYEQPTVFLTLIGLGTVVVFILRNKIFRSVTHHHGHHGLRPIRHAH
jgi:hypothetical protein